ncbi:hypothetical protein QFC21_000855 [Naganishia friedmannii]|uniref:Uncharacterized protein n=1 Tax=Naganishia friedmannii TaxID=89922 RepID=A0ACC2W7X2_9TREE|nr:hypothetical protein QFC21_000855 [Naganishia friedmannii]
MSEHANSSNSRALISGGSSTNASNVSLTRQVILDEDEYTASLSHIIKRDFFPNLDRLSATNNYLSALESQDTIAIADSIRYLSALTPGPGQRDAQLTAARHRQEREMADVAGTPYISRTPFGGAGMETPMPYNPTQKLMDERDAKRRKIDLSSGLDNFQAAYTSEDNSSFMEILQEDNRRKKEKYSWAYAAEEQAKQNRLRLEQSRRQLLIEAGGYVPNDGLLPVRKRIDPPTHRLALTLPGNEERGTKQVEEGKGEPKAIHPSVETPSQDKGASTNTSLVVSDTNRVNPDDTTALIRRAPELDAPDITHTQLVIPNALPEGSLVPEHDGQNELVEIVLDPSSHLARALAEVGLPETAIVTRQGELVPSREFASGAGEGLGRGEADRRLREAKEKEVMGELKDDREKVVPTWGYKTRNALMFGPDADVNPVFPGPRPAMTAAQMRADPPEIRHANTRLEGEDEGDDQDARSSRRGTSPSRSRVGAAIAGKQYQPSSAMPRYGNYPLVPVAPSPSPSELGSDAVKQLMTWGTLLGTPRALDGDDSADADMTPNNFKISEPKRRDEIGRRLATNASKSMRERAKGFGSTPKGLAVLSGRDAGSTRVRAGSMRPPSLPTPGSVTPRRREEALTPAGRSLLQRSVFGTPGRGEPSGLGLSRSAGSRSRGEAMERANGWNSSSGNKASHKRTWTPSPAPRRS